MPPVPELRRKRYEAALTQQELAEKAGVARSTVVIIEQGCNARPSTIRKLSLALACRPIDLLTNSVQPEALREGETKA